MRDRFVSEHDADFFLGLFGERERLTGIAVLVFVCVWQVIVVPFSTDPGSASSLLADMKANGGGDTAGEIIGTCAVQNRFFELLILIGGTSNERNELHRGCCRGVAGGAGLELDKGLSCPGGGPLLRRAPARSDDARSGGGRLVSRCEFLFQKEAVSGISFAA